ncbi:MAG: hypothetical protein LVR00_06385 [Rhabdochlamydiaceae bacterium]|jgi:hypothetical protein
MSGQSCCYAAGVRLASPAWGGVLCAGAVVYNIASAALLCGSCCYWKGYADHTSDNKCTPRGPGMDTLDECASRILRCSSFAPNIDSTLYSSQTVKKFGQGNPEHWVAHHSACCLTASCVGCCAISCGIFSVPCACCGEDDICVQTFEKLMIGKDGLVSEGDSLVTSQPRRT